MNTRIINTESYMYSAIACVGRKGFTSNEIAKILIDKFALPKSMFKAKAFVYSQLQILVLKEILTKTKQKGIYQHIYTRRDKFDTYMQNVDILPQVPLPVTLSEQNTGDTGVEKTNTINSLIRKYEVESEKTHGAKAVYDELSIELPERQSEFRRLSDEQHRKLIRLRSKINTLSHML